MEFFYMPWFGWIIILAIIVGGIISIVDSHSRKDKVTARLVEQNAELNEKVVARLEAVDSRLESLEKTLTDLPD